MTIQGQCFCCCCYNLSVFVHEVFACYDFIIITALLIAFVWSDVQFVVDSSSLFPQYVVNLMCRPIQLLVVNLMWRPIQLLFFIYFGTNRISHEHSSLYIIVIFFMFSLWCIDWVGSLYASVTLCHFVVYSTRRFGFSLALCYYVIVFLQSF